ncbi:uncharacterized protein LOC106081732 [Stomoxys calcitrans]|uniref:uncharacterized protein LOC106081732 n=1 Tax=Stomoxys calcitrans TaxID=35570 RepID=UPI0027E33CB7|nr:uncharacterized protein LOC106081732 [Stomoxys calcitrans]
MSRYSFNAMIQLSRQLPLDAELEVLLHYRVPHSKKVAKLINIRFKECNTFTALPLVPLLKNIIDKIAAHGNFPFTCPVRGNVMYNASNLIITDAILPSYMPIVQFNFTLNILNKGKAICHYLVQGSTTAKT